MDGARLKNVAIILLCLINIILAGNLIIGGTAAKEDYRMVTEQLAAMGVEADARIFKNAQAMNAYEYTRSPENERYMAEAFLGKPSMTEATDGSKSFSSEIGSITFSRYGDVRVVLDHFTGGEDELRQFLTEHGVTDIACTKTERKDGKLYVTLWKQLCGARLYNGELTAVMDGKTMELTGKWMLVSGRQNPEELPDKARQPGGLAINFAVSAKKEQINLTKITATENVYYLAGRDDEHILAMPAYLFTTAEGKFVVNALDGSILER